MKHVDSGKVQPPNVPDFALLVLRGCFWRMCFFFQILFRREIKTAFNVEPGGKINLFFMPDGYYLL